MNDQESRWCSKSVLKENHELQESIIKSFILRYRFLFIFLLILPMFGVAQAGLDDALNAFGQAVDQIQRSDKQNGNGYQRGGCPRGTYQAAYNYCVPNDRVQCELNPSKSCPRGKQCAEFNGVIGCFTESELYRKRNATVEREQQQILLQQQKQKEEILQQEVNRKNTDIRELKAEIKRLENENRSAQTKNNEAKLHAESNQQQLQEALKKINKMELIIYALAVVIALLSVGFWYQANRKNMKVNIRSSAPEKDVSEAVQNSKSDETTAENDDVDDSIQENTYKSVPEMQICRGCGNEYNGLEQFCSECGAASSMVTHCKQMLVNSVSKFRMGGSTKVGNSNVISKLMKLLGNVIIFVSFYLVLMIPTYILPYMGSNSAVVGTLAMAADAGINPAFWLHLGALIALIVITWFRGVIVVKKWLIIFPIIATVFDLFPGLSAVPFVPTIMHLCAIIIGVKNTSTMASPENETVNITVSESDVEADNA